MTDTPPTAEPPPQVPTGIEVTVQFFPAPGDIRCQRLAIGGVDTVVCMSITPSSSVAVFYTVEQFRAKIAEWTDLLGGIQVAQSTLLVPGQP